DHAAIGPLRGDAVEEAEVEATELARAEAQVGDVSGVVVQVDRVPGGELLHQADRVVADAGALGRPWREEGQPGLRGVRSVRAKPPPTPAGRPADRRPGGSGQGLRG